MTHCNHCGRKFDLTSCPCQSNWSRQLTQDILLSEAAEDIILESSETELREAMGDKEFEAEAARGQAVVQRALDQVHPPKWHQLGPHFNIWTLGGIVVVAILICYFTNTYPWIDGIFKL